MKMEEKRVYPRPVPSAIMQSLNRYFEVYNPLCEVCHEQEAVAYSEYYDLFWCRKCGNRKTDWMLRFSPDERIQKAFTNMEEGV